MNAKILVVDDEKDLLELLSMNLGAEGFLVTTAQTAADALAAVSTDPPDLILLDIILPDISGINLTGKLKNSPITANIPIILLTAKDTETDVIVGLSVGADDYVTKPFSTKVLLARIENLLKRPDSRGARLNTLTAGPVTIVPDHRQVYVQGKPVELTSAQFDILLALMTAAGRVLSRTELNKALGETTGERNMRIVTVHIAALRKKLGPAAKIVKTVHAKGYRIRTQTTKSANS